jgi:2Fe-2S ferredoxin
MHIHVTDRQGKRHTLEALEGFRVMEIIRDWDMDIKAECGGACACGTCHCFLEGEWRAVAGEGDAMEEAMLGMRPDRTAGSRLSCQIGVSDAMDGMVVRLPEYQM